jgi:hypothetical protein
MKTICMWMALITIVLSVRETSFAQARGSSGGRPMDSPMEMRDPNRRMDVSIPGVNNPTVLTTSVIIVSGELIERDSVLKTIQIREKERGKEFGFTVSGDCKIRADKKEFGKKELKLDELEEGYRLELTISRYNKQVIEMRVRKPKDNAKNSAKDAKDVKQSTKQP